MIEAMGIKEKLGLDVFKPSEKFHISIKLGMNKDSRLKKMISVCPAGLYTENSDGEVSISEDGCLECGTCLVVCGSDVLEWFYPIGGTGVQFRFG